MPEANSRVLIVANKTLGGTEMLERIQRLNTPAGAASFYLLVPATPIEESKWDGGDQRRRTGVVEAQQRLDQGLAQIAELGADADGEVGEANPIAAVSTVFDRGMAFDRILLSTLVGGLSKWLGLDVPRRLKRITELPIEHIQAEETVGSV